VTPDHRIHVIGYDPEPNLISSRLECLHDTPTLDDNEGTESSDCPRINHWCDEYDALDLVWEALKGPPPWDVTTTWTDDGPQLRQAQP
jgi:hypothetical protein